VLLSPKTYIMHLTSVADCRQLRFIRLSPVARFRLAPRWQLFLRNREAIARLCRLHGVRSLEAFGSILRDDFDAGRGVYLEDIEHYAAAEV
jgi:hypothetical protein